MGKKKPFIDKKGSSKFVLLHRSQQDADYGKEGASEFVLFPAAQGQRDPFVSAEDGSASRDAGPRRDDARLRLDHINELGLPNDGYDYAQHLKAVDADGVIVGRSGRVLDAREDPLVSGPTPAVLPDEVLPSREKEKERAFDAITISDACMDKDMASIMFGEAAFEELDDAFVLQAAGAGDAGAEDEGSEAAADAFDYDAHIARLIARSERETRCLRPQDAAAALGGEGVGNGEEDEEASDEEFDEEFDEVLMREMQAEMPPTGADEAGFEALMVQYDSDECGALDDPEDDPTLQGQLDLKDLDHVLDEFIETRRADHTLVSLRDEAGAYPAEDGVDACADGAATSPPAPHEEATTDRPSRRAAGAGSAQRRNHSGEAGGAAGEDRAEETGAGGGGSQGRELDGGGGEEEDTTDSETEDVSELEFGVGGKLHMPEYLAPKETPEWDCETIVSTYSNLDNHPRMIHAPAKMKSASGRSSQAPSVEDNRPRQIVLSNKTGMPIGALAPRRPHSPDHQPEAFSGAAANAGAKRDKTESKEDKRARKQAIKSERLKKRQEKKTTRSAFKQIEGASRRANVQAQCGVATFKYV